MLAKAASTRGICYPNPVHATLAAAAALESDSEQAPHEPDLEPAPGA
jgi:hypothetical protein